MIGNNLLSILIPFLFSLNQQYSIIFLSYQTFVNSAYTNRLKLPFIHSGQAQKEITHNEALNILDILVNPVVQEINIAALPEALKSGQLYIIGQNPEGELTKYSNKIAQKLEHGWRYITPPKWLEVTRDKDGSKYRFNGNNWQELGKYQ